jgi:hypothetical protein
VTGVTACASLVWRARHIGAEPSVDDWAGLSGPDVPRAAGFTHPAAMTRFVVTRALLRATIVQLRPELARTTIAFDVAPSGRLEVVDHPELAVSSSHTGTFAVAAVAADGPVGIDVEPLDRGELPRPAAWLTPQELAGVTTLDAHTPHETDLHRLMLLHLWVAKEAVLKAWPGPGTTARQRIRISCRETPCAEVETGRPATGRPATGPPGRVAARRAGGDATPPPPGASWCGDGQGVVAPGVAWAATTPSGSPGSDGPTLDLGVDWYVIDSHLVALAHRHPPRTTARSELDRQAT